MTDTQPERPMTLEELERARSELHGAVERARREMEYVELQILAAKLAARGKPHADDAAGAKTIT